MIANVFEKTGSQCFVAFGGSLSKSRHHNPVIFTLNLELLLLQQSCCGPIFSGNSIRKFPQRSTVGICETSNFSKTHMVFGPVLPSPVPVSLQDTGK